MADELQVAELLRLASRGRAAYVQGASPEVAEILETEANTFENAAKLTEDPSRIWMHIPSWMAVQAPDVTPDGVSLIGAERQRQVSEESWTAEHDDRWVSGELARAGASYALPPPQAWERQYNNDNYPPSDWPWDRDDWKPSPDDRIKELVKAGALIAAEIDRLIRAGVT